MMYPKELFVAREDVTRNNIKKYEKRVDNWYKKVLELYPNYYQMNLRERMKCNEKINDWSVKNDKEDCTNFNEA